MSHRLEYILDAWFPDRDRYQWVLATILETRGSAYRKAGARMMINSMGQCFGLLSGGCLESDLMHQARKCWSYHQDHIVTYDMQEDSETAWQLGIGCGGKVCVLLQPVGEFNRYHHLIELRRKLADRKHCYYQHSLPVSNAHSERKTFFTAKVGQGSKLGSEAINQILSTEKGDSDVEGIKTITKGNCFTSLVKPRPAIAIVGGGVDAIPVVTMAATLGWHISVFDSRSQYARPDLFALADEIIHCHYQQLLENSFFVSSDAIVIMNHNVTLDAQALIAANQSKAKYVGLLGPRHRTEKKVLVEAGLEWSSLDKQLHSPIGLDLGGELPESIALSIIAEVNSYLE